MRIEASINYFSVQSLTELTIILGMYTNTNRELKSVLVCTKWSRDSLCLIHHPEFVYPYMDTMLRMLRHLDRPHFIRSHKLSQSYAWEYRAFSCTTSSLIASVKPLCKIFYRMKEREWILYEILCLFLFLRQAKPLESILYQPKLKSLSWSIFKCKNEIIWFVYNDSSTRAHRRKFHPSRSIAVNNYWGKMWEITICINRWDW